MPELTVTPELKAIIEAATDPEVIRNAIVAEAEKQAAAAVVDEDHLVAGAQGNGRNLRLIAHLSQKE